MRARWMVLIVASSLAGCAEIDVAVDVDALEVCTDDSIARFEHVVVGDDGAVDLEPTSANPRPGWGIPAELMAVDPSERSVCDCPDYECVVEWVAENIGCNLCGHVVCESGTIGACAPCASDSGATGCLLAEPDLALGR